MRVQVTHDAVLFHVVHGASRAAADRQLSPVHLLRAGLRSVPARAQKTLQCYDCLMAFLYILYLYSII